MGQGKEGVCHAGEAEAGGDGHGAAAKGCGVRLLRKAGARPRDARPPAKYFGRTVMRIDLCCKTVVWLLDGEETGVGGCRVGWQ